MLTMLNNIEIIAFRAAEMIKQLLTFARKDRVLMQPLQFTSFIKEAMRLLHGSIPANITVKQEICTEMLEIKGDRTLLHQVMMNLINNACDAVDHSDAPCISLVLEAFTPSTAFLKHHIYFNAIPYAHLTVSDNGCGIAKEP